MPNTTDVTRLHDAVFNRLSAHGWTGNPNGLPTASNLHDSIDGPKQSLVRMSKQPDQEGNLALTAEFWSEEGRNVLGNQGLLIPIDAETQSINKTVDAFVSAMKYAIADTSEVQMLVSKP